MSKGESRKPSEDSFFGKEFDVIRRDNDQVFANASNIRLNI